MGSPRAVASGSGPARPETHACVTHRVTPSTVSSTRRARLSARWPDLLGLAWVVVAGCCVLAPAIVHGASLGPYNLLARYGVTSQRGVAVLNTGHGDQIREMIPWTTLAWTQVHHGHLPLWNPYSALGMPLAFNWQSSAFSVPALIGYLFPVHLAYTVGVVTTLVIAGTGAYFLGRVLGLGVLGSAMAGTVFELGGSFMEWLGWPVAGVMSWAGWLFAAAILVVRGGRRVRLITFLAVVVAGAIYAGQPDTLVVLILALVVFLVALLALRTPWLGGSGPLLRPVADVAVAVVAGGALGAPLALPGLQLIPGSNRTLVSESGLSLHYLVQVFFQWFDGRPGILWFGPTVVFYSDVADYVGVIAVVLAVVALARRWRQPEVVALAVVAFAMGALVFVSPLVSLMGHVPFFGNVRWVRALGPMSFALAVLAGVGLDVLVRSFTTRAVRVWSGAAFLGAGVALGAVWLFGRGQLPPAQAALRAKSFIWPAVATVVGLVLLGGLATLRVRGAPLLAAADRVRRGAVRTVAVLLLLCETAFLVVAGTPLWSSSPRSFAPTPSTTALERAVGSSVVGAGVLSCFGAPGPKVGILPNANLAFGVHEFAVYDPLTPRTYKSSWFAASGQSAGLPPPFQAASVFCPAVTTAQLGRLYGVEFVLEPPGTPGPQGAVFDERIGAERLYRIPGAAPATLTALGLPADARGTPVAVTHPDPASWKVETHAATSQVLRLRLTDVPGWHASLDGHPLPLRPFNEVMLQADIPPGSHTVELHYWPERFTVGIVLALVSVLALVAAPIVEHARRRRSATRSEVTA